jgi:flagellar basal body rod protein FlgG
MAANGRRVLDADNQPITLDDGGMISIDGRGNISQNGEVVATLGFVDVPDANDLKKDGDNLMRVSTRRTTPLADAPLASAIKQRLVEDSAVDAVKALNDMTNASKAVQANITMMQYHDNILGQVINTYGRVA